jgi:hypothetical protein
MRRQCSLHTLRSYSSPKKTNERLDKPTIFFQLNDAPALSVMEGLLRRIYLGNFEVTAG